MEKVRLKRQQALDTIRKNRDQHVADFNESRTAFDAAMLKRAREVLKNVKNRKYDDIVFSLPRPVNYEEHYEVVISMLEASVDDEIELTQAEYQRYMMDRWEWKRQFAATTQFYKGEV